MSRNKKKKPVSKQNAFFYSIVGIFRILFRGIIVKEVEYILKGFA